MGKGELWDDSALTAAFDEAISTYKKMHGKVLKGTSTVDVEANTEECSTHVDEIESHVEEIVNVGNGASHAALEMVEVENMGTDEGNKVVNLNVPEEHVHESKSPPFKDRSHHSKNHSYSIAVDEYNQLYKQYCEVEEQRQGILQKMQQFCGWNYTDAGEASASDFGTQAYQSSVSQLPCGTMVVSCCSCACPGPMAPCSAPGGCDVSLRPDAPATIKPEKLPKDADVVKMAMGAAERAISSLKNKTSDYKEEDSKICYGMEQNVSSDTDLSVVLNAWYSAGFHTGKYLTERSLGKKQW